jgi:hypothetical protein
MVAPCQLRTESTSGIYRSFLRDYGDLFANGLEARLACCTPEGWCYRSRRKRDLRSLSMLSETTVAPSGAATVVS